MYNFFYLHAVVKSPHPYEPIRPDSIDLLFLGSFPDPFERVERDKNKTKSKKGKNVHENTIIFRKKFYFFKIIFSFPFHERTEGSEKQQIN